MIDIVFCFTGSTNGTYVSGREVRKNVRSRVYNGDSVRLGAENVNGEAFVTFDTDLTGAKELDKNTEYGQLQALIEAVGGVNVVITNVRRFARSRFRVTAYTTPNEP